MLDTESVRHPWINSVVFYQYEVKKLSEIHFYLFGEIAERNINCSRPDK